MSTVMRLSDLQRLCADMAEAAAKVGNYDPQVVFFDIAARDNDNLIIAPMENSTVVDYMQRFTGSEAEVGDFALALKRV